MMRGDWWPGTLLLEFAGGGWFRMINGTQIGNM
uniref:Uncharacterized protein n=1 Tax=Arundo donax TaxID=35708 RepID=A0A0A9C832_ARUDO